MEEITEIQWISAFASIGMFIGYGVGKLGTIIERRTEKSIAYERGFSDGMWYITRHIIKSQLESKRDSARQADTPDCTNSAEQVIH